MTLEFFLFHIMKFDEKPLTEDFILGLLRFKIILILIFFEYWVFVE